MVQINKNSTTWVYPRARAVMKMFTHGCCVPTSQALWMVIVLFTCFFLAIIACMISAAFTKWVYKRRMRKKVEQLKEKFRDEAQQKLQRDLKLKEIAHKPPPVLGLQGPSRERAETQVNMMPGNVQGQVQQGAPYQMVQSGGCAGKVESQPGVAGAGNSNQGKENSIYSTLSVPTAKNEGSLYWPTVVEKLPSYKGPAPPAPPPPAGTTSTMGGPSEPKNGAHCMFTGGTPLGSRMMAPSEEPVNIHFTGTTPLDSSKQNSMEPIVGAKKQHSIYSLLTTAPVKNDPDTVSNSAWPATVEKLPSYRTSLQSSQMAKPDGHNGAFTLFSGGTPLGSRQLEPNEERGNASKAENGAFTGLTPLESSPISKQSPGSLMRKLETIPEGSTTTSGRTSRGTSGTYGTGTSTGTSSGTSSTPTIQPISVESLPTESNRQHLPTNPKTAATSAHVMAKNNKYNKKPKDMNDVYLLSAGNETDREKRSKGTPENSSSGISGAISGALSSASRRLSSYSNYKPSKKENSSKSKQQPKSSFPFWEAKRNIQTVVEEEPSPRTGKMNQKSAVSKETSNWHQREPSSKKNGSGAPGKGTPGRGTTETGTTGSVSSSPWSSGSGTSSATTGTTGSATSGDPESSVRSSVRGSPKLGSTRDSPKNASARSSRLFVKEEDSPPKQSSRPMNVYELRRAQQKQKQQEITEAAREIVNLRREQKHADNDRALEEARENFKPFAAHRAQSVNSNESAQQPRFQSPPQ